MPAVAPVAVEPREFKSPTKTNGATDPVVEAEPIGSAAENPDKSSFPLIPILAGIVGVVVLGLLIRVLIAK